MINKNVFVVGLDDANRRLLERIPHASEYIFHGLLNHAELFETYDFPSRYDTPQYRADTRVSEKNQPVSRRYLWL